MEWCFLMYSFIYSKNQQEELLYPQSMK